MTGQTGKKCALRAHDSLGIHQVLYTHIIPTISRSSKEEWSHPPILQETEA